MISNQAKILALRALLREGLVLRLYCNNFHPSEIDAASSYQEVRGGGYEPVSLDESDWERDGMVAAAKVAWEFSGPATPPYGFYITTAEGEFVTAERFVDGPYPIQIVGDGVEVEAILGVG